MKTYEDELLEEYYKGQTNGFNTGYANAVDKAVEWLKNNADKYTDTGCGVPFLHIGIMINDFKKAMKQ
jgi:hypothetical protein